MTLSLFLLIPLILLALIGLGTVIFVIVFSFLDQNENLDMYGKMHYWGEMGEDVIDFKRKK